MFELEMLLNETAVMRGHLCCAQVLGVRMAMAGCRALEVADPRSSRRVLVHAQIDSCAAQAVGIVTGCWPGRGTLEHTVCGKRAAVFVDVTTNRAVSVAVQEEARERASAYVPEIAHRTSQVGLLLAYAVMPDEELLAVEEVEPPVVEEGPRDQSVATATPDRRGGGEWPLSQAPPIS